MPVCDGEQRLVVVQMHLAAQYDDMAGRDFRKRPSAGSRKPSCLG
jgi:hypothetical protein